MAGRLPPIQNMNKRTKIALGSIAALAVIGVAGYRWWMNGEPVRIANEIRSDIEGRRWDEVFAYTVAEERDKNGWTKESFSIFAEGLTTHLKGKSFGSDFKEIALPHSHDESFSLWNLKSERRFQWTVPFRLAVNGDKVTELNLTMVRDVDGKWKAMFGPLLRDISRSGRQDPMDHIKALREALANAGLPRYYNLVGDRVITVASLDKAIRGEIARTAVWEKVTPENP